MCYDGEDYYYRKNILGDIIAIYDVEGNEKCRYTYDAFGNHRISGDTTIGNVNPFRYRGYYYDTETELYYLQSRYYDPEVGRFISADDVSYLSPETVFGLNLYAYCGNNPVMNVDPTGRFVISSILLGCIIVGAVAGAVVGGYIAGDKASEAGATGWELFGWTLLGVVGGGVAGGAIGLAAGWASPAVGGMLSGSLAVAGGGYVAAGVASTAAVASAGVLGLLVLMSQWVPGSWPGDDPTIPPGDGFEWRGPGEIGSEFGDWYNPITHDQLHPDLNHPLPKGPHWGWRRFGRFIQDIFKYL